ncbi:MAG: HAMP domain-containing histidine kinase [Clostridium sp.]|nr:HAMP domain-containing histidine kinase [Clostridium sp.]
MDTKWKNRKSAVSFIIFFLGVSLTLGGIAGLIKDKPSGARLWQFDKLLQNDYQQSVRFQNYMEGQLENFLSMATGGIPNDIWEYDMGILDEYGISYDDYYYNGGFYEGDYGYDDYYGDGGYDEPYEYGDGSYEEVEAYEGGYDRGYYEERWERGRRALTEEERKKIAESYHDKIRGDKNLLYSVSYDGALLYSNSDALDADGGMMAMGEEAGDGKTPDGTELEAYNFFLYFDGEKVKIIKDGRELDVYGDGYYREKNGGAGGSSWYVPGYRNFPVNEKIKKVKVCLAAAKEPVLYSEAAYGNIGSRQLGNTLYWLSYDYQVNRDVRMREIVCLLAGAALLVLAFFIRKSCRKAAEKIAGFQAKIWAECKVLLIFGVLYLAVFATLAVIKNNYGYGIWQELEIAYSYEYEYGAEAVLDLSMEALKSIPPLFWIVLFWVVYFIWNDLKYNKKVWKHGLIAKLYRTFSVKTLEQPLSRKIARRNGIAFAAAIFCGLLTAGAVILEVSGESTWGAGLLSILGIVGFLVVEYLVGAKNMETAKDVEALAVRVGEIRGGNYADIGGEFSGHDLETVMEQLEDIQHGMAKAVDEQMKSERMKVELIANVSHDIKTPLTSIISYVQFLKQEEGLPDHVKDYVMILDEKSQRLKNMVQDVFAVSKAASGELPVHMEELDFGKLLRQTMADMEEQINNSAVTFRTEIPDEPVMITADGQRMYRVFQNLFLNAIQYSLDGSRVYVTLTADGETAQASVKNTSHMELDKNKDFAERFARGDQSRTDGGSGLGLSIAQSFTEACKGEFAWETDADLFVVKVRFQRVGEEDGI